MWERVWSGPQPVWMLCLDSKKTFLSNLWWGECAEGSVGGWSGGGVWGFTHICGRGYLRVAYFICGHTYMKYNNNEINRGPQ